MYSNNIQDAKAWSDTALDGDDLALAYDDRDNFRNRLLPTGCFCFNNNSPRALHNEVLGDGVPDLLGQVLDHVPGTLELPPEPIHDEPRAEKLAVANRWFFTTLHARAFSANQPRRFQVSGPGDVSWYRGRRYC